MLNNLISDPYLKALVCLVFSFALSFLGIKIFLARAKAKFIQPIRDSGPATHKAKKNTPTMGGMFIIAASVVTSLLFLDLTNHYVLMVLLVFLSFGVIGLVDDLLKVYKKNVNGFKGSVKLVIQFLLIAAVVIWLKILDPYHLKNLVILPFAGGMSFGLGNALYFLLVAFVIVGSSNAVNLTDGLDGLVSVPAIINLLCLIILILAAANPTSVFYTANGQELIFFCVSLIGAILAFLKFNLHPAKIFMGDVGSLAIGAALGVIAVILKQEIVFFIISLVFVAEAVSVILQVGSYKLRKKRIFLMAPLHHHFEKLGFSEKKVVCLFWSAAIVCAGLGLSLLY